MKRSCTSKLTRRKRASNAHSLNVKINFSCTDELAVEQNCRRYIYHASAKPNKTKSPRPLLPRRCIIKSMLNVTPLLQYVHRYTPTLEGKWKRLFWLKFPTSLLPQVGYNRMKSGNEFWTAFLVGETQLDSNLSSLRLDFCINLFLRRWFWFRGTNMIMRCWTRKVEYSSLAETELGSEYSDRENWVWQANGRWWVPSTFPRQS